MKKCEDMLHTSFYSTDIMFHRQNYEKRFSRNMNFLEFEIYSSSILDGGKHIVNKSSS